MCVDTVSSSGPEVANLQVFILKKKVLKKVANLVWFDQQSFLVTFIQRSSKYEATATKEQTFYWWKNNFL